MTVYEVTAMQRAIMCARDIIEDMIFQQNDHHNKPVLCTFGEMWSDLDGWIDWLNDYKVDHFPDKCEVNEDAD